MQDRPSLEVVLREARREGFLGPGPVSAHIEHAEAMAEVVEQALVGPPGRFCDLGSGAGVPGLVLVRRWPAVRAVLIESGQRRCRSLGRSLASLGLTGRVRVLEGRAEELGREPAWRECFPVVVARSFGSPAVTAEVGTAFVSPGGLLVVAEPPERVEARWPVEPLKELGLGPALGVEVRGVHFAVLEKVAGLASRWPRRVGIPAKRPCW